MTTDVAAAADKIASTTVATTSDTDKASTATATTATTSAATDKGGASTIVGSGGGDADKGAATAAAKPNFPDNWREILANGDDKRLTQLKRYSDPMAFAQKTWALEQKVTSGEYKAQLPAGATDEQVAAFRKEAGLPEKADGYVGGLAMPNGHVLGEADKAIVADFAEKVAHKGMMSQEHVNKTIAWYYGVVDAMHLKQEESDSNFKRESEDVLRAKMGGDFRPNINAVDNLVSRMGDVGEAFLDARIKAPTEKDPSRTVRMGDHPAVISFLAQLEREFNPAATLVPPGGGDPGKTIEGELAAIRKRARDDPDGYDRDKAMQERRRVITEALEKMKPRAA